MLEQACRVLFSGRRIACTGSPPFFPLLKDGDGRVADGFGATRTPEVFLLDAERRIRYRGRIDDQDLVGLPRARPSRRDLAIAVEELQAGKPVSVPETQAAGCFIDRS